MNIAISGWDLARYSELGSVDVMSAELARRPEFSAFLRDFEVVAQQHALADRVGAFLLHRHFLPGPGALPIEYPEMLADGQAALVTAPTPRPADTDCAAVRWAVADDPARLVPLEFSVDPGAVRSSRFVATRKRFLDEFAGALVRHRLTDLLGLCVVDRDFLAKSENEWFVEETEVDRSVVRVESRDAEVGGRRLIETVWLARVTAGCQSNCVQICKGDGKGGHNVSHGPNHVHTDDGRPRGPGRRLPEVEKPRG
jgi:hypothetical protein